MRCIKTLQSNILQDSSLNLDVSQGPVCVLERKYFKLESNNENRLFPVSKT